MRKDPKLLRQHSVCLYEVDGGLIGTSQPGEDLLTQLCSGPCWVVDNNAPWEQTALQEPGTWFAMGRTMALESDSLRGALKRLRRRPLRNVVTVEIAERDGRRVIEVDRLDAGFTQKFSALPTIEQAKKGDREDINSTSVREAKRQVVLKYLASDPNGARETMLALKPSCVRHYEYAGEVSLACYSLHLRELRAKYPDSPRVQLFETNGFNLFGDAELIQDALFLSAGVFSSDRTDVGRMAQLLEIPHRLT